MGLFWSLVWAISNAATGVLVKLSGLPRPTLLFGQFAVATVVLTVWHLLLTRERDAAPWPAGERGWLAARTFLGLLSTYASYEAYASCLAFGPALASLNALYLPLLGLFVPALIVGWRKGHVVASSLVCLAGLAVALSAPASAACAPSGLLGGALAGAGLAAVALAQSRLQLAPTFVSAAYCGLATVAMVIFSLSTHTPLVINQWGIVLGLVYALVQVSSQIANRWNPVVSAVLGLSQLPISAIAAVFVFGDVLPWQVWTAMAFIAAGLVILRLGKEAQPRH